MKPIVWTAILLDRCVVHAIAKDSGPHGTINTSSGAVRGHKAPMAPAVTAYLGIPYAQPPVGPLRFAPPQYYHPRGHEIFGDSLVSRTLEQYQ